jgi:dihydropteroate synthase
MWPHNRSYRCEVLDPGRGRPWRWGTRTHVMGIVNATDDSFSGDGLAGEIAAAIRLARSYELAGVDIIDVGGASSRPGADPTPVDVELDRVVPVIEAIRGSVDLPISVDTTWARVAESALDAGASVVNDICGLRLDPDLAPLVAERGVPVVAMHNQRNRPHTDVIDDIRAGCEETLRVCAEAGLTDSSVVFDPGFGFGWSVDQNLEMLRRLPELWDLELPLLIGTSRKSSIGKVLGADLSRRRFGTAATIAQAICAGVDIVRVHDAGEMGDVVTMTDAIVR